MAFRMQSSVPDLMEISGESRHVLDMYGPEVHVPGSAARSCLLARRLVERGVRFVQLYHRGWDQHGNLPRAIQVQAKDTDQGSAALVTDLKERGLLDETLIIWGGEFGRTVYSQGDLSRKNYGRDHHAKCFTMWLAGGGIKGGVTHGPSDQWGYKPLDRANPTQVYDIHATILHLLGIDHEKLTVRHNGIDRRLTDVHGHVIRELLA